MRGQVCVGAVRVGCPTSGWLESPQPPARNSIGCQFRPVLAWLLLPCRSRRPQVSRKGRRPPASKP